MEKHNHFFKSKQTSLGTLHNTHPGIPLRFEVGWSKIGGSSGKRNAPTSIAYDNLLDIQSYNDFYIPKANNQDSARILICFIAT